MGVEKISDDSACQGAKRHQKGEPHRSFVPDDFQPPIHGDTQCAVSRNASLYQSPQTLLR